LALDAAKMGEVLFDLSGGVVHTPGFASLFGYPGDQKLSLDDIQDRYHPDDSERVRAHQAAVIAGSEDRYEIEHRVVWPDGSAHWLAGLGEAAGDRSAGNGQLTAVYMDVTQRKLAEEQQKLLLDELNHRVKNTLATVQSIFLHTRRDAETAADFDRSFSARLQALAGVHDLLTQRSWEGTSLSDVIAQTLAPHVGIDEAGEQNIVFGGPAIHLGPNAAVTLTMAFHELATNACKYGALSVNEGRLDVKWTIDRKATPKMLSIAWTERHGPEVAPPTRRGFGSRLIKDGLDRELDAIVDLRYEPAGVRCTIDLPASNKLSIG
jgi:PAS domain S-box-containing protein